MNKIWIGMLLVVVLLMVENVRELHTFRMTHYDIVSPKLQCGSKEWKAIFVSDLHNCVYGKNNRRLIEAIQEEEPDVILSGGDLLIGSDTANNDVAVHFLKEVSKIAPVYCGRGNHEQRLSEDVYEAYKEKVSSSQVHFLENDSTVILLDGGEIRLTAFELPEDCYTRFQGRVISVEEIEQRVQNARKDQYQILLAHHPMHVDAYEKWGADLVLSGHLHGGIVRIPFWRGAITPQALLFPKYAGGKYQVGKTDLVVSKGLGTHTIPVRLFNEAEVVVLHIRGE